MVILDYSIQGNGIAKKRMLQGTGKRRTRTKLCIDVLVHFPLFKIGGLMVWSKSFSCYSNFEFLGTPLMFITNLV